MSKENKQVIFTTADIARIDHRRYIQRWSFSECVRSLCDYALTQIEKEPENWQDFLNKEREVKNERIE